MRKIGITFLLLANLCFGQSKQFFTRIDSLGLRQNKSNLAFNKNILRFNLEEQEFYDADIEQDSVKSLSLKNTVFQRITFTGYKDKADFALNIKKNCSGKSLSVNSFTLDAYISTLIIDSLNFSNSTIKALNIQNTTVNHICLQEAEAADWFYISRSTFCNTIDLRGFRNGVKNQLSTLSVSRKNGKPTTLIFDYSTKFDGLDIDLSKYHLQLDEDCSDCDNKNSYTTFFANQLAYYKENGQDGNYKTLYFLYRSWLIKDRSWFAYFFEYYLPREFYGFGLEKVLIFRSTFILLIASFFLFLIAGNHRIADAYDFEIDQKKRARHSRLDSVYKTLLYTIIVFFALKLDYTKMKFDKHFGLLLLLLVFVTGIICYAFLANFIFTFK